MPAGPIATTWQVFRLDAARWIEPQAIGDPDELSARLLAVLMLRHMPLRAMAWLRLATLARELGVRGFPSFVQRHLLRVYGLEISPSVAIGGGLYIAHPVGCVLHAESIGANVTVVSQVTFGTRNDERWPVVGDLVEIGVGARILGGIRIGDRARIGANSVVMTDVPVGATAVGAPARIILQ